MTWIMDFEVRAIEGGKIVAQGRGETLKEALIAFADDQRENFQRHADLSNAASRSIVEVKECAA